MVFNWINVFLDIKYYSAKHYPEIELVRQSKTALNSMHCALWSVQTKVYNQGISGLDCWIDQSIFQSNFVDWIVIDNPKSKLDFGFGLSIQFCHFNPYPKYQNYFIVILKFHSGLCFNNNTKLLFSKILNN